MQPILPILAAHFGPHGERTARLAATVPSIGMMVGGLVGGWLIVPCGKRAIILGAIAALAVFGVAEALINSPTLFLADRLALAVAPRC